MNLAEGKLYGERSKRGLESEGALIHKGQWTCRSLLMLY